VATGPGHERKDILVRTGLCSVTLRRLPAGEVITAARTAGLESIEWGGDVHVPHGDIATAREVRARCAAAGITCCSYGSYFRAASGGGPAAGDVIATAAALGAPRIRVWAGALGSSQATVTHRRAVVADLRRLTRQAADAGIGVALEYHAGTLTDTFESARRLLDEVGEPGLSSYWQPPVGMPDSSALADFQRMSDVVSAVHVFAWWPGEVRVPLGERAALWSAVLGEAGPGVTDALIEFVPGDDPSVLSREAAILRGFCHPAEPGR
jgi:3-dehydroshikimate dehydratase